MSSHTLSPTKAFYINKSSAMTKMVHVNDITASSDLSSWSNTNDWHKRVEKQSIENKNTTEPYLMMHKSKRLSRKYTFSWPVRAGEGGETKRRSWFGKTKTSTAEEFAPQEDMAVATMPSMGYMPATIQFSNNTLCSHPISMNYGKKGGSNEKFVVDSVPYEWTCDNTFTMRRYTLNRMVPGDTKSIAYFWAPAAQMSPSGGVLIVDDRELNSTLVIISCMILSLQNELKVATVVAIS
jgi:hypothetical protein